MEVLVSTVSDKCRGGERMSAGRFMPSLPFLVKVPISLFKTARKEAVRQKSWDLNRIVTSPRRVRTLHRSNYTTERHNRTGKLHRLFRQVALQTI